MDGSPTVDCDDALSRPPRRKFDYVLANPPFGRRSESSSGDGNQRGSPAYASHLPFPTGNKQLGFLQHVTCMMKAGGKAAVVVPDNVLFERGVGDGVRRMLLEDFELHTILRLPTGIFYAQGVKANVMFFDRPTPRSRRKEVATWFYDLRTDVRLSLKTRSLGPEHLTDFVNCFSVGRFSGRPETSRFRRFERGELLGRTGSNLDLRWRPEECLANGPGTTPASLADLQLEIVGHLEAALSLFKEVTLRERRGSPPVEPRASSGRA